MGNEKEKGNGVKKEKREKERGKINRENNKSTLSGPFIYLFAYER